MPRPMAALSRTVLCARITTLRTHLRDLGACYALQGDTPPVALTDALECELGHLEDELAVRDQGALALEARVATEGALALVEATDTLLARALPGWR